METSTYIPGNSGGSSTSTAGTLPTVGNVRLVTKGGNQPYMPEERECETAAGPAVKTEVEVVKPILPHETPNSSSTVIQTFEGAVLEVDQNAGVMTASLRAKFGNFVEHSAVIDLSQVHEQDHDLVRPGAVFYLTLFRKHTHGSLQNFQEIRFRRAPTWSSKQVNKIWSMADDLAANLNFRNARGN